MTALLFIVGAYLLGSIPFAVVASKALRLPDPRTYGSNNPGATNVLRSGNKQAAILTLVGDVLKGAIAVLLARHFFYDHLWVVFFVAIAVFLGHVFSLFLRFKGGKGVATALGVLLGIHWMTGLVALGIWLVVAAIFRYSSVAALAAALGASVYTLLSPMHPAYVMATVAMAGLLIWRHSSNIKNLIAGTETRIGGGSRAQDEEAEDEDE